MLFKISFFHFRHSTGFPPRSDNSKQFVIIFPKMKALYFNDFGAAEVLRYGELPEPEIKNGQALVRMHAVGLNFADVYRRRGNYHLAGEPPFILGYEGAGEIVAVGESSQTDLNVGDRAAFADSPFANAELVAVDVEKLVKLPAAIDYETAAAVMLQGLTAHYLTNDSHLIKAGETALVHAAAGGVGLLLTQIIKIKNGKVLAVVSSEAKRNAQPRSKQVRTPPFYMMKIGLNGRKSSVETKTAWTWFSIRSERRSTRVLPPFGRADKSCFTEWQAATRRRLTRAV